VCAHVIRFRTHHPRPEIEKNTLSLLFIEVFRCVRTRHPPSASFIRFESLTAISLTYADRSGWKIIPTRITILIEFYHQITEYVCRNPHVYNLCLTRYNGAKIATNTWVSDALDLFVVMFYYFKLT